MISIFYASACSQKKKTHNKNKQPPPPSSQKRTKPIRQTTEKYAGYRFYNYKKDKERDRIIEKGEKSESEKRREKEKRRKLRQTRRIFGKDS